MSLPHSPRKPLPAHVVVTGNEKGGSGKTTVAMHLAVGLLHLGFRVGCIDLDSRQQSLARYIQNREAWIAQHRLPLAMPESAVIAGSTADSRQEAVREEQEAFAQVLAAFSRSCDFVIIDCPGSDAPLARTAHMFADTLITPINDSLLDLDLIARLNPLDWQLQGAGVYSDLVWTLRSKRRAERRPGIDWVVTRSRVGALADRNKQKMTDSLSRIQQVLGFRLAEGFGERIIYRYLFLWGLTVLDLRGAGLDMEMTRSHLAARREVLALIRMLWLPNVDERLDRLLARDPL
ncbi:ATPase MipZ [mine drainage metagenome]|uniref:ATPase MipZ n=1 Tax=mine drainage metagenome TaxID=410659 RepID=A0A1J5RXC1_9ZZZZ